jgi:hypothetical protein
MNTPTLPRYQAGVLAYMLNAAPIKDPADILEFRLAGPFRELFYAAHSQLGLSSKEGLSLVFTLATYSGRVYMTLVNDHVRQVARVLANLEDYDRERGVELQFGDSILLPDDAFLKQQGRAGALLLDVPDFPGFDGFPEQVTLLGKNINFSMVVFITSEEYSFKKKNGLDGLVQRFIETDRDLTSLMPILIN